jgi:flagellar basal-body rod modification protein FlgD
MTNSVSSSLTTQSTTNNSSTSSSSSQSSTVQPLGQDAFLKLLMAQLQNQDPLNPTDDTEFVTQLSQFSLVEQSVQQSSQLTTLGSQLQNLENSNATVLVGQNVTVNGGTLNWNGSYAATSTVSLGAAAQSVTATVSDSNGNAVRTMTLGPQQAGPLTVTWDGHGDDGQSEPSGTYSLTVSGTNANGQAISVSQQVSGTVASVSFTNGSPSVTLTNGTVAPVSSLVSVGMTPNNQ